MNPGARRRAVATARDRIGLSDPGEQPLIDGGCPRRARQVEAYDAAADRWSAFAPMPTPRHGLTAIAFEGRIHVLSGGPQPGGSYSAAHEVLSP